MLGIKLKNMKGKLKKNDDEWFVDFFVDEMDYTIKSKSLKLYQEHLDKSSKYYLENLIEGEEVEFMIIEEFTHQKYFENIPLFEGDSCCLILKRKPKFEIPKYDPYTGDLNPYYEELTGNSFEVKDYTLKNKFCDEVKMNSITNTIKNNTLYMEFLTDNGGRSDDPGYTLKFIEWLNKNYTLIKK